MTHNSLSYYNQEQGFQSLHQTIELEQIGLHHLSTERRKKRNPNHRKISLDLPKENQKLFQALNKKTKNFFTSQIKNRFKKYEERKNQQKELNKIPILRNQEDFSYQGLILYKGMAPRTSDRYFTFLKQVDFDAPITNQCNSRELKFNSNFQCGNLNYVIKSGENIYDLYLRVDTNTKGHRQWYYFSVKNKKPIKVIFKIYRFNKALSLYQRGMRPYVLSKKQYKETESNWKQSGTNIKYLIQNNSSLKKKYILSFQYQFKNQSDEVYFAACPPYSYTYLNKSIENFKKRSTNINFSVSELAKSICGLSIPLITIENKSQLNIKKKFIVISGRTHPGESVSSWVIQGIIKQLVQKQSQQSINNRIIYKIIPMLNPDGVFVGNYRTGIIGSDFNRKFNDNNPKLFPEIDGLKRLIQQLKKQGDILCFFDIHGHSILRNSFIFGPCLQSFRNQPMILFSQKLLQKSCILKKDSCKFKNQKEKIDTARVYFQFKQNILTYTVENSLGLYFNKYKTISMEIDDWVNFGRAFPVVCDQIINLNDFEKQKMIQKLLRKQDSGNIEVINLIDMMKINQIQLKKKPLHIDYRCNKLKNEKQKIKNKTKDQKNNEKKNQSPKMDNQMIIQSSPDKDLNLCHSNKLLKEFNKNLLQDLKQEIDCDKLSQNFDQNLNDEDSSSEDMNQQQLQIIKDAIQKKNQNSSILLFHSLLHLDKNKSSLKNISQDQIQADQSDYIDTSPQKQTSPSKYGKLNGIRQFIIKNKMKLSPDQKNDTNYKKYEDYRKKKENQRKQKQLLLRLNNSELRQYNHTQYQIKQILLISKNREQDCKLDKKNTIHTRQQSSQSKYKKSINQKILFQMIGKKEMINKFVVKKKQ